MSKDNIDDVMEDLAEDASAETSRAEKIDIEVPDEVVEAPEGSSTNDLKEQLQDAEGRVLRAQAELENFRIRVRRETEDQLKFANQKLLTDMLPVIDNIYRAVEAATQDETSGGLLSGVNMVAQQLLDTIGRHHCKQIAAVGEVFDPNLHEAIQQMPSDEFETGHVMLVVQEGYTLHDRVIRPAHVIISTGPAAAE